MVVRPEDYFWSSAREHLKLRNKYFVSKMPFYFSVQSWRDYLFDENYNEDCWIEIRKSTLSTKKEILI